MPTSATQAQVNTPPPIASPEQQNLGEKSTAHNLPAPITRFVGRQEELRLLQDLLRHERFITLVGPGGAGKTRLAVQAGWQALADFRDGVWLVPLMAVTSPDVFLFAITEALQLPAYSAIDPQKQIVNFLRGKRLLLILDNFEQLIPAANLLPALLQQAPEVTVLITSRQRLNLYGECAFDLTGLGLPAADTLEAVEVSSAGQLFVQNARRARPNFSLTGENYTAIIRICRLVEGMPLALELAGTWARAMSCEQIAAQIEQDLDFLAAGWQDQPDRRRSMRAMLEHSWGMLTAEEQQTMRGLSVFAGSFDLPAAQSVAQVSLAELVALVDKSLLHWDAANERYESHPLLKRFATERLAENKPEQAAASERHSRYFLDFVGQRQQILRSRQMSRALREIGEAISDVRQAWDWAVQNRRPDLIETGLEGIYRFYEVRGWFQEGEVIFDFSAEQLNQKADIPQLAWKLRARQALLNLSRQADAAQIWLPRCLDAFRNQAHLAEESLCLYGLARLEQKNGRLAEAKALAEQSAALAQSATNLSVAADSLLLLAEIYSNQSNYPETEKFCEQALQAYRRIGDPRGEGTALWTFGAMYLYKGDLSRPAAYGQDALEIFRSIGDVYWEARTLDLLGGAYTYQGLIVEARPYQEQALALWRGIGGNSEVSALNNLAFNYMGVGDFDVAQRYFEQSLRMSREIGKRLSESNVLANLAYIAHLRGDESVALEYGQQAARMAQEIGHQSRLAYALRLQADALLAQGQLDPAEVLYRQSYDLQFDLKRNYVSPDALAGLAEIALERGDLAQAIDLAAKIMPEGVKQIRGHDPIQVYLTCYRVWRAANDPRAMELIRHAYGALQETASQISDAAMRHTFVERYPSRRGVAREFAALEEAKIPLSPRERDGGRANALPDPLTRQEVEVLRLLAEGLTNQQIAEKLVITVGTAKFHVHNMYIKLGAQNRTQAVARGRELELV